MIELISNTYRDFLVDKAMGVNSRINFDDYHTETLSITTDS